MPIIKFISRVLLISLVCLGLFTWSPYHLTQQIQATNTDHPESEHQIKHQQADMLLTADQTDYAATDQPTFTLQNKPGFWQKIVNFITFSHHNLPKEELEVVVKDPKDQKVVGINLSQIDPQQVAITVEPQSEIKPGKHILIIKRGDKEITQDFTWGVLAINTDQPTYEPGDDAHFALAVLDEKGNMVCDADLNLEIKLLGTEVIEGLSTAKGDIKVNDECHKKEFTLIPDFETSYHLPSVGTYQLKLTAKTNNGEYTITDQFEVQAKIPFKIIRHSATRIYPPKTYPVKIDITPDHDFTGVIKEIVPSVFEISADSNSPQFVVHQLDDDTQSIEWQVEAQAGENIGLKYFYQAPNVSPEFYLLGPIVFYENDEQVFVESRPWQIASDWSSQIAHANVFTDTNDLTSNTGTTWKDVANTTISDADFDTAGIANSDAVLYVADVVFEGDNASGVYAVQLADTNGVAISNTEIRRETRTSDARDAWVRIMTKGTRPDNAGVVLQKRFVSGTGASAYVHKAQINVISLQNLTANSDYVYAESTSTSNIPASGSPATFATITTPSGDSNWQGDVLVMDHFKADANANVDTDSLVHGLQRDSDSEVNTTSQESEDLDDWWGGGTQWVYNNADTSAHTYNVRLQNNSASGTAYAHVYSSIIAFRASLFEDFQYNQTTGSLTGATTYTEAAAITPFTPTTTGDFFITGQINAADAVITSDDTEVRIQVDATTVPTGFAESTEGVGGEETDDEHPITFSSIENLSSASTRDIDLDARSDEGTNSSWDFRSLAAFSFGLAPTASITVSGQIYTDEGASLLDCSTSRTVNLKVNGAGTDTVECSNSPANGTFSFSGISAGAGDIITVYLDGETEKAVAVTESPGTDITNLDLYQNHVIVRHDNSGSLTIDELDNYDKGDDPDILFTATNSTPDTLVVDDGQKLFIWTGDAFAPGGNVTVDDIEIQGTYTAATGEAITVSGTWDHSGTFTASTSTVTFDAATTTESIYTTGTGAFNNVVFNDAAGSATWNVEDPLDVDGNFTITGGTVDVVSGENNQINVGGNWTNDDIFVERSGTVVMDTATTATLDSNCTTTSSCTSENFYNLTLSKGSSTDTVTLTNFGIRVTNTLTLTTGTLVQGTYNIQAEGTTAISVGANGILSNTSTGDIALGGNVSNSGTVTLQASGTCGSTDDIAVTAVSGTPAWSGAGTYTLYDVSLTSQNAAVAITVFSGTNVSGNTGSWTFSSGCPAATVELDTSTANQIQIDVANRYRAIMLTNNSGTLDNYIRIYDRAENDSSPTNVVAIGGANIGISSYYYTHEDNTRTTTILEANDARVKIRVEGCFATTSGTCLNDGSVDSTAVEEYTFTPEGVFVSYIHDFGSGFSLGASYTYQFTSFYLEETSVFSSTALTGSENSETSRTINSAFTPDDYFVAQGTGSFQDVMIAFMKGGHFSPSTPDPAQYWESSGGSTLGYRYREYEYGNSHSISGVHTGRYFITLQDQTNLDTTAERYGLAEDFRNPDLLTYTTGSEWDDDSRGVSDPSAATPGLLFDATNDYVDTGYNGTLTTQTYEAWIYPYSWGEGNLGRIIDKRNAGAEVTKLYVNSSGQLVFDQVFTSGNASWNTDASSLSLDTWHHVAVTYDSSNVSNNPLMYIDGTSVNVTQSTAEPTGSAVTNTDNYMIGNRGAQDATFDGIIDEVRIWSDIRTANEIQTNIHSQIDASSANLEAYYRFNEYTGTTTYDETSNNRDGTLTGGPTWVHGYMPDQYNEAEGAYTIDASGNDIDVDIDGDNNVVTTLNDASVAAGDTTFTLTDGTNFSSGGGIAYINGDKFSYSGKSTNDLTGVPSTGELAIIGHANSTAVSAPTRHTPAFKLRNYQLTTAPSSISLEGSGLTSGADYILAFKPFTDADFYNATGTSYTQLAVGGDTSHASEYLFDTTNDYTLDFNEAGDYFYIGSESKFSGVNSTLATAGSGTSPTITWQYCSANTDVRTACDTWSTLSDTDTTSGASNFTASGNFYFGAPYDWVGATVNSGTSLYYIRGYLSSGSYSVAPIEDEIKTDTIIIQYLSNITAQDQTLAMTGASQSTPTLNQLMRHGRWFLNQVIQAFSF